MNDDAFIFRSYLFLVISVTWKLREDYAFSCLLSLYGKDFTLFQALQLFNVSLKVYYRCALSLGLLDLVLEFSLEFRFDFGR